MDVRPPIFVITGQLSAGKSTVARALLDRYERGFHIDVDGIREMVGPGLASPLEWTDETTLQFSLAIRASAALARIYADAGYAVAIDGSVDPELTDSALEEQGIRDRMMGIVLHPRLAVALQRNRSRQTKSFDTLILEEVMRRIEPDVARDAARPGWHAIDNSDEPVHATVDRILSIER
jgi:chloramphenicol 3-O-phosphotransferase